MSRDMQEIAYEIAIRALDQQERRLEALRLRAGTLLAASSIALSLLGPTSTQLGLISVAALVAFLVSATASLSVLVPRVEAVLSLSPLSILDQPGDADTHRRLVAEMHGHRQRNDELSERLATSCQIAGLFLAGETFLLVIVRSGGII